MTEERVYRRWYLLPAAALLWNETVYYAGRFLAQGSAHTDMSTPLDGLIPFMPWMVTNICGLLCVLGGGVRRLREAGQGAGAEVLPC